MPQLIGLLNLAFVVLIPAVPAYLLFRSLPSTAIVKGPLKGLTINLGGAFAGYFALMVLILSTHSIWNPPPSYQVWEIEGEVTDDKGKPIQQLDINDFQIEPAAFHDLTGGKFKLTLYTMPTQGGNFKFQDVKVILRPFRPAALVFDAPIIKDTSERTLKIPPLRLSEDTSLPKYSIKGETTLKPVPPNAEPPQ